LGQTFQVSVCKVDNVRLNIQLNFKFVIALQAIHVRCILAIAITVYLRQGTAYNITTLLPWQDTFVRHMLFVSQF